MSDQSIENNGANGTGTPGEEATPGRCFSAQQREPGRHPATARKTWSKDIDKVIMECFYRSNPFDENGKPIRGYRQRMFREWRERGKFGTTGQRICDQARTRRKNGWLSELELEEIKRKVDAEVLGNEEELLQVDEEENNNEEYDAMEEARKGEEPRHEVVENEVETEERLTEASDETKDNAERLKAILVEGKRSDGIMFKKLDRKALKIQVDTVNEAIKYMKCRNITETNNLILAESVWVAEKFGLKTGARQKRNEPWWKRRIEGDIRKLRHDVNLLEIGLKGQLDVKKTQKIKQLNEKYRVNRKGIKTAIEESKQRMVTKSGKLKRYEYRIEQFRQNRMFGLNQKFYDELNKSSNFSNEIPNAEECTKFWGDIWSVEKEHNRAAVWLKELKKETDRDVKHTQDTAKINTEKVKKQSRKLPNWRAPGPDGVQGHWLKHFTALHERIASQPDGMLTEEEVLQRTTHGRTVLCQKDPQKGTAVDNFRPSTRLPLMWKLLTGIVADEMYQYLEQSNILPDEQKGCRRRSRDTKDQLLIDRDLTAAYEWGKKEYKVNHLLFMDDLKLYVKTEDQMSMLVRTDYMFNNDIGMEFGKDC
ncbi:uncharacterized protein LOC134762848 [Penaeus indicus]|uniref:uncharacterized protein LOC134762848 n=1 Tax=Penaeus indicus TaxID=29960 RepID=UPI00300CD2D1